MATQASNRPVELRTHPDRYRHWRLEIDGQLARLILKVDENHPLREGYSLKLNSYDLSVDIELSDAVERLRFGHPEVKVVVLTSGHPSCFCAGANIYMLGTSSHGFKVTSAVHQRDAAHPREASRERPAPVAALNGVASVAATSWPSLCCIPQDDGNSAVSSPRRCCSGAPGTGGSPAW